MLGGEVIEEGAVGDIGPSADFGDGGGLETRLTKQAERILEDAVTHLEQASLPSRGATGFGVSDRVQH